MLFTIFIYKQNFSNYLLILFFIFIYKQNCQTNNFNCFNFHCFQLRSPTEKFDLKPSGTANETIKWLKTYKFHHLIPVFCKFKCKDMLELTVEEAIDMCGRLQGTRLFYKIHKKKPSKLVYFSIAKKNVSPDDSHWKPVIFTSINTCNLIELLKEKFDLKHDPCCYSLALKTFGRVTNIDDDYLNEIPDKSMYRLDVQGNFQTIKSC